MHEGGGPLALKVKDSARDVGARGRRQLGARQRAHQLTAAAAAARLAPGPVALPLLAPLLAHLCVLIYVCMYVCMDVCIDR